MCQNRKGFRLTPHIKPMIMTILMPQNVLTPLLLPCLTLNSPVIMIWPIVLQLLGSTTCQGGRLKAFIQNVPTRISWLLQDHAIFSHCWPVILSKFSCQNYCDICFLLVPTYLPTYLDLPLPTYLPSYLPLPTYPYLPTYLPSFLPLPTTYLPTYVPI